MLEHAGLLLEPLRTGPNGPSRVIRDASTRDLLGRATLAEPPGILGWFLPRTWVVCEVPDDSLLCNVKCPWKLSNAWTVYDAEGVLVATLANHQVVGPDGWVIAVHSRGRFRTHGGTELAAWHSDSTGTMMQFRPMLDNEPLVKMMLLAAVLEA